MGRSSENFSATSFMLLKPEEVGFFQLIQILFCNDLHKRCFMHCHEVVIEESFNHKYLIFASLLAQKLLQLVANPLKSFGHTIELFLNLISSNYNVFKLLINFLPGKEVVLETSENYLSIIGHLDKRVELDNNINREDPKYSVMLSMMASKISYENESFIRTIVEDHWKMKLVACGDYWNDYQGRSTTRSFILLDKSKDHDTYVVAFRGTNSFDVDAWSTDIDISWLELSGIGKIHAGFMKALGLQKSIVGWPKEIEPDHGSHPLEAYYAIRGLLKKHLDRNDKAKFILTGHSLGGALAILFLAVLMLHDETFLLERLERVYTFGQPRVGDEAFAKYMEKKLKNKCIKYYRFTYNNDIIPRLPYDDKNMMFKHFGTCIFYDREYNCKIVHEEPNKNYFSWSETISMMVNAFWELVRSFTIVGKYGSEYEEGRLQIFFRLVGLALPGFPSHLPQDYVNATRLGSIPSQLD